MKYSDEELEQARKRLAEYPKPTEWRLLEDEEIPRIERKKLTNKPFEFGG